MKKFFIILVVFGFVLSSCSFIKEITPKSLVNAKLKVVTTNSVLHDFALEIGGNHVGVMDVGSESDFEKIKSADVFIYAGDLVDPWAKNILETANETGLTVIDSSIDVEIDDSKSEQIMVENIASGLIVADPKNKDYYQKRADELEAELGEPKVD